ncbi:hypothetical protein VOLCADRAFT_95021 [Volvox carteri f. nagariensis]|uniref:ABC transporter domain-containing protein n=1 Tax=Volvox carteri f. nagariensis TaxID=3068 RepID=D8U6E1_VOLCA|nr:uncharacterized protein VOLCADRAFT_95021 [Volvox carteri f. nagariensis]EFJ44628.1 hypothetical protein VOLCADRAFT_95021 [Volvox carteri f. nagariensis]|eukprot:XP_002954204.1 hypothetical protein VOLCADRAFT_95021 [Volvox carteri f. nagariensis]
MTVNATQPLDVEAGVADGARRVEREKTFAPMGMRIVFKDLDYSVPSHHKKGERAFLLKKVAGYFEAHQMAALMGPSGSGKTTLLDVLAGRKNAGVTEGTVAFAGQKPTPQFLRRYTGYVEQFDTLLGILTVYEMLLYTAELKRPVSEPLESKKRAVEDLLDKLALSRCRDVKHSNPQLNLPQTRRPLIAPPLQIGNALSKGISGGQAKRTNIEQQQHQWQQHLGSPLPWKISTQAQLLVRPCPSPSPSPSPNQVMTMVKSLAAGGVTICATIHSPTSYCFALFDSVMMLVKGRVVYFGPRGHSAIEFAQSGCPHPKEFLPGYNDAEYLVDLVTEADLAGESDKMADFYAKVYLSSRNFYVPYMLYTRASSSLAISASELFRDNAARIDQYLSESADVLPENIQKELAVRSATVTPWWWGLKTLVKSRQHNATRPGTRPDKTFRRTVLLQYRTSKNYRDGEFLGPRIGDKILISLLIMTLYLGIGDEFIESNYVNIAAVLFMWCVLPAFGAAAYVPALVLERNLFTRERNDGLYLVVTYLLSKMVDELLLAGLASLGISAYVFYGIQLQGQWVTFWLIYYITLSNGIVLAYFVAAISPNLDVANALLPTYVVTLLFFGGFLFRFHEMPRWWKWYSYIDFLRYSWGSLMVNQFEDNNPSWLGGTVLSYYSLAHVDKWRYMGFLALFFIVFFLLALITMQFKKYQSR